jgi:hypothetical protein
VERSRVSRGADGHSELVQDLVLADDDRIASHRHRHGMTGRRLVNEKPATRGKTWDVGRQGMRSDGIGLHAVARLDDDTASLRGPVARCCCKPLALVERDIAGVRNERNQLVAPGSAHRRVFRRVSAIA